MFYSNRIVTVFARVSLLCLMTGAIVACQKAEQPTAPGPAQQIGAKIDAAAAVAGEKIENFSEKHAPQIEAAKQATKEGARKITGVVGEQMEKAGQKAQDVSRGAEK